jgi:hypothetical protein
MARGVYRHPHPGRAGRLLASLLNSPALARLRRSLFARLPFPVLESEVRDVVYLTWLVDADAARFLLPPGLRLWQRGGKTPLTVLTYRHGHFGPARAGRLRRLFPSPLQSNWRLYLDDPLPEGAPPRTVYFLDNVMDSRLYVAGTRLFSDVMQTHLPASFRHGRHGTGYVTRIDPGEGSAPRLSCVVGPAPYAALPPAFAGVFASWREAVEMLACQDAAVAWSDRLGQQILAHIDLPVPLDEVRPLAAAGTPSGSFLDGLPAVGEPLCFLVPRVRFRVLGEGL